MNMEKIVWGEVMDVAFIIIFAIISCITFLQRKQILLFGCSCGLTMAITFFTYTKDRREKWNNGVSKKTGLPWKSEFTDSANCTSLVSGPNSQGEIDYMTIHFKLELSEEERKKIKF